MPIRQWHHWVTRLGRRQKGEKPVWTQASRPQALSSHARTQASGSTSPVPPKTHSPLPGPQPHCSPAQIDRVEWGDGSWLSVRRTGVCVRKEKNGFASKSDEGGEKVCSSGGKSLDCKWQGQYHPLESSCQIQIFFHSKKIYNTTTL